MRKSLILIVYVIGLVGFLKAQNVGINSTGAVPDASAGLDVSFSDKGVLMPRVDIDDLSTESPITSATTSLLVYNTNTTTGPGYFYWDGTNWIKMFDDSDGKAWKTIGNAGTTPGTNFLGTIDDVDLAFNTNNSERMRIINTGEVGIGTTTPSYPLTVTSATAAVTGAFFNTEASSNNYAVYGDATTTDNYGFGGVFLGGYIGVRANVTADGSGSYFGIYSNVSGGTGNNYGIYGKSDGDDGFGMYAKNTNTSGTGLLVVGNNASGTYLTGGSAIAATGTITGVLGYVTDADGTGLIGTGDGQTTITTLTGGSGIAGSGLECGVYGIANSATGSGVLGQNSDDDGWAGNFQGNTNMGISTDDVHNFWGTFQAGSASDSHVIVPQTDNYGYVGTSSLVWYYMYSNNFIDPSRRELKRDINPLNKITSSVIMSDIEKMKPSLYKYNFEDDNMEKGNEAKYRPNAHLGLILDEVPDYMQDNAFSGVDIYALGTVALTGVKYNRESIKKLQEKISDFGSKEMVNTEMWVSFESEFSDKLSDNQKPIITITSNNPNITMSIIEKNNTGFKVKVSQLVNNLTFDWIAMAKVEVKTVNMTNEEIVRYKKQKQLIVSDVDKHKVKDWDKKNTDRINAINAKRKETPLYKVSKKEEIKHVKEFKDVEIGKLKK